MLRFEIVRRPVFQAVALLSLAATCTPWVAAQGPDRPRSDRQSIREMAQRLEKRASTLSPNERRAWSLILRMIRADQIQPYLAREIRQIAQGKETEQWVRVDPDRGVRIENIRPDNKIILDTQQQAYIYDPDDKKWVGRPSAMAFLRGIFGDLLRRLEKGDLKASLDGQDTIAGRPCAIVRLSPPDGVVGPSHRFWIDKATGLRTKIEVVGQEGRIFTTSYFLSLDLTPKFRPDDFTPPEGVTSFDQKSRGQTFRTISEAQQAKVDVPEPRYIPTGYTLQKIEVFGPETRKPRITLRYSNGLSVISLTQFKSDRVPPRLKERVSKNAPGFLPNPRGNGERAYLWQSDGNVMILFSALPDDEVKKIADLVKP